MVLRSVRLALWFCVGLFLGGYAVWASAETIAASTGSHDEIVGNAQASCQAVYPASTSIASGYASGGRFYCGAAGDMDKLSAAFSCPTGSWGIDLPWTVKCHYSSGYYCPSGQNWTLSGSTCTRPDCPYGRNADGTCQSQCAQLATQPETYGWYTRTKGTDIGGQYCTAGCQVSLALDTATTDYFYTLDKVTQRYVRSYTGQSCPSDTQPAATVATAGQEPTVPPKKPPCDSSEGVLTSSSGRVACVPSGTPSASPPEVQKTRKTEAFPDGSAKTTETTTTIDPSTRAVDVTTNTTSTGGQAGPAGTTTSTKSFEPNVGPGTNATASGTKDNGDFCAQNPNLQLCKGDMAKEETLKKVADSLSGEGADLGHITGQDGSGPDKDEADAQLQRAKDLIDGVGGSNDAAKGIQEQFRDTVSGWFEPVPMVGCQPFSGALPGGRTFTIDHCPVAEKVSSVADYVIWVLMAFGFLRLVTSKAE